jgi:hypothetical protein
MTRHFTPPMVRCRSDKILEDAMRRRIAGCLTLLLAVVQTSAAGAASPIMREIVIEFAAYLRLGADCPQKAAPELSAEAAMFMMFVKPPVQEEEIARKQRELEQVKGAIGLKRWCAADYVVRIGAAKAAMLALSAK